jgi:RimJ/RimL family protein N-acetyltransferase
MKSARLTYRPLDYSDAARITHLAGDWDIARMTARIPHPYTLTQAHQWIGSLEEGEVVRVVELDRELIGAVGYIPNADGSAEIGYWIGRPWWGNGYATEAAEALVRFCFTEAGYSRLTCCHFVDNPASQRIIRKLGFRVTGPCKAWCEARGAEVATVRYQKKKPVLMRVGWVRSKRSYARNSSPSKGEEGTPWT